MRILLAAAAAALLLSPPAVMAQRVGTTAAVNPDATGQPPGGQSRLLIVGTDVVFEEKIVTSENGQTQLLFVDQSSLTVGPNAEVVLDRFVYDPNTSTGELALSITKGVFRFVGGKISASSGATIETPAATLGIRGSIVYGDADADCACLEMIYVAGEQLTAANAGGTVAFQRPGRRISVASPSRLAEDLGRASADDIAGFAGMLEGRGGGGAPETPTDVVVEQRLGPPAAESVLAPSLGQDIAFQSSSTLLGTVATVDESTDKGDVRNDAATEDAAENQPEPPPPPPPPPGGLSGRLLATPDSPFTADDGTEYSSPLAQNVLGGPDPVFSPPISGGAVTPSGRFQASTSLGPIDLPFQLGGFVFGRAGTDTPFGPIAGFGAGGPGFVAYAGTQVTSSTGNRLFIVAGEPTPDGGNLPSADLQLSTYDVIQDPVYQADIPFVPGHVAGAFANPTVSDLYILRRDGDQPGENGRIADDASPNRSRFVIAAGSIEGTGSAQKSFLLGSEGSLLTTDNDKLSVTLGTRGSFRSSATDKPAQVGGSLAAVSDADANQFFGPNLNFFALTTSGPRLLDSDPDVDVGSAFYSPYAFNATPGEPYSYAHLATQTATNAEIGTRSTRALAGYAAVIGETRLAGDVFPPPYLLTTLEPTAFVVTEAATNSIAAQFDMIEISITAGATPAPNYISDVNSVEIGFGGVGSHVGSYIDDERYAARETRNPNLWSRVNGALGRSDSAFNTDGARSLMVSHELVPMAGFPAEGSTLTECSCFEWGWWASEFRWADTSGPNRNRRERFHMGTFVVGDIPGQSEVEAIIQQGQVATYGGHIIGNVYNQGAQYIAAGNFSHRVDFGARAGSVEARFDQRSYSGASSLKANVTGFQGHLTSTDAGPAAQGFIDGSFVRNAGDPVGGMIGTKRFYDVGTNGNDYRASTTFAGAKVPNVQD